jgi:hypothetical protein
VTVSISGGSAAQTSGKTDADGHFTTAVTATGAGAPGAGAASLADGTLTITADATSFEGVSRQAVRTADVRICGAGDPSIRTSGTGDYVADVTYGHGHASGNAPAGVYNYGSTEWIDPFVVHVDDPALDGQPGYVYIKVHYHMTSSGYSDSNPAARVVTGDADIENDWEIPISCRFNRDDAPLDVNADAYAKATPDGPCTVSAEVTWMGITKITTQDGTPVADYWICSGSKTDYTQPQ